MDNCAIALYEIKRQAFLIGYIQFPDKFSSSLAYAYDRRIAPIFHDVAECKGVAKEDPFSDAYVISEDFASDVIEYVEHEWLAKNLKAVEFYKIEEKFGGRAKRAEIKFVLEYAKIDRRFDKDLWDAVVRNAPSEANNIKDTFTPDDIYFG